MTYLWIGLGGFLGANARFLIQTWAANHWGVDFPYGTLLANVSGAFILTLFATLTLEHFAVREEVRLLVTTGFLGGYTTFSSLVYETWRLADSSGWWLAGTNLLANILLGAIGVIFGLVVAHSILG